MNYRYRVTLAGIKGFFRVYLVNGENSLYTFHKQLRADLEFPMDQPILLRQTLLLPRKLLNMPMPMEL